MLQTKPEVTLDELKKHQLAALGIINDQEKEIEQLRNRAVTAEAEMEDVRNREAACCPEDVPFNEYIKFLDDILFRTKEKCDKLSVKLETAEAKLK